MLRAIKDNLAELDNRQLSDTLFSIGKLHKRKLDAEVALESRLFPFFYHLINEFLIEVNNRVAELEATEIAYLLKGVTNLIDVIKSDEDAQKSE